MSFYYVIGVQAGLTQAQMENNADIIYQYFSSYGVTLECICGMLGNWQKESTLNPGCKQGLAENDRNIGWGLIQWSPASVLTNWCRQYNYNWYDGYAQCYRVWCEGTEQLGAGGVWLPDYQHGYTYTWNEFISLTDVNEAVYAWLYERGRGVPETLDIEHRLLWANQWYEYFTGQPLPPTPPTPPSPSHRRHKMPLYMMLRKL